MRRLAAAVLVIAACGRAAGGDRTVLELANWGEVREAELERRALRAFEQAHPGVTVQQQSAGTGQAEYRERILTSMVAGRPPDVFLLDNIDVPAFADRGVLLDLAPYLPRLGIDPARYDSTVLAIFRRGDALYALPKGYTPMVVVYNKDLFDRAGVPYPTDDWTWDDFLRTATTLTRDSDGDGQVDQWGTAFDRRVFLWLPWIWSGGGDVLCADGRRASGCLDSPTSVAAIRWYTNWVTADSVVPRQFNLRRSLGDNLRLFYTGKVAMLTTGHFWIPHFR
ncbi:MAG: ABC transporter substrate-binding protein, partial [Gemmatimonadales bacterium]